MALYPSIELIELTDDELKAVAGGNPFNNFSITNSALLNSFNNAGNVSISNSNNNSVNINSTVG